MRDRVGLGEKSSPGEDTRGAWAVPLFHMQPEPHCIYRSSLEPWLHTVTLTLQVMGSVPIPLVTDLDLGLGYKLHLPVSRFRQITLGAQTLENEPLPTLEKAFPVAVVLLYSFQSRYSLSGVPKLWDDLNSWAGD